MKTIIFIFSLFWVACVSTGLKARSIASENCTIGNYRDIVFQDNAEPPKCDFWGAKLRYANLRGADLRGADLFEADLRQADLRGADLREANLRWADLWQANLQGADLRRVKLASTKLKEADLRGADLREVDFGHTNLRYADLRGADLQGARFNKGSWRSKLYKAKVDCAQAEYLESQGITGFESPSWFACLFDW